MTQKARDALGPEYGVLFENDLFDVGEFTVHGSVRVVVDKSERDAAEDVFAEHDIETEVMHATGQTVTFAIRLP